MTIEEFWQDNDKDYMEFEYRKPLVPNHVHVKLSWLMKKLHEWYYLACKFFKILDIDLHGELGGLHTIYHLIMLNITIMAIWCV
jgi:hypothetical protein